MNINLNQAAIDKLKKICEKQERLKFLQAEKDKLQDFYKYVYKFRNEDLSYDEKNIICKYDAFLKIDFAVVSLECITLEKRFVTQSTTLELQSLGFNEIIKNKNKLSNYIYVDRLCSSADFINRLLYEEEGAEELNEIRKTKKKLLNYCYVKRLRLPDYLINWLLSEGERAEELNKNLATHHDDDEYRYYCLEVEFNLAQEYWNETSNKYLNEYLKYCQKYCQQESLKHKKYQEFFEAKFGENLIYKKLLQDINSLESKVEQLAILESLEPILFSALPLRTFAPDWESKFFSYFSDLIDVLPEYIAKLGKENEHRTDQIAQQIIELQSF